MPRFIIYFNQQWVGNHSVEWYKQRGPLARAVVSEMKEAGVLVFAGGLDEEIERAVGVNENGEILDRITSDGDYLGGLTIIEVSSAEEAIKWGSKIGFACGWPQEIRKFKED